MDKTKPFGLILSKKSKKFDSKKKSVFDSSSDEEIAEKGKYPKVSLPSFKSKAKVKVESTEDPGIYEYDNIYDEMKANQATKSVEKKKQDSRYIESLLKAATKRKKEHERKVEKKIHIEREKEGDKFKDKEQFVTSAYKKKMQEMEEEEKRENRENQLNEMMDVTKQNDLCGFYRHFLKQTVGEEKVPVFGDRQAIKVEKDVEVEDLKVVDENNSLKSKSDRDRVNAKCSSTNEEQFEANETQKATTSIKKDKLDLKTDAIAAYPEDCDDDSNLSDSDSLECEDLVSLNFNKHKVQDQYKKNKLAKKMDDEVKDVEVLEEQPKESDKTRTQKDIFAKRTIGLLFDEAQARYFQRSAQKAMT